MEHGGVGVFRSWGVGGVGVYVGSCTGVLGFTQVLLH